MSNHQQVRQLTDEQWQAITHNDASRLMTSSFML